YAARHLCRDAMNQFQTCQECRELHRDETRLLRDVSLQNRTLLMTGCTSASNNLPRCKHLPSSRYTRHFPGTATSKSQTPIASKCCFADLILAFSVGRRLYSSSVLFVSRIM